MASYGAFLTACGYEQHGPKGHLGFGPRLTPEDFRAPFTTAEGWGTFTQKRDGGGQKETIAVRWGSLRVRTLAFTLAEKVRPTSVKVTLQGKELPCRHTLQDGRLLITLAADAIIAAGRSLEITIG